MPLTNTSRISDPWGVGSSSEPTALVELALGRVGDREEAGVGSGSTVRVE